MAPRIILSTTNDIATDSRVHKVAMLLHYMGVEVVWIGRFIPQSPPLNRPYKTHRMSLWFQKGALFYAEYQIRLFFYLLRTPVNILHANDLDTLLPNFLISKIKGIPLVYDTHEYFCGVPEIQGRWVKKVWKAVESNIFPKLKYVWTVNKSIARLYFEDYGIRPKVFRNISPKPSEFTLKTRAELGLPEDALIAINQGSGMNVDRGLEEALTAISRLPHPWMLLLVGSGDAIPGLKLRVQNEGLQNRILFIGRVPYSQLLQYTSVANVGLSLDKDTNINYRFSLPNKLFDYIHCGIPVVTSQVVEVQRIVQEYNVGATVNPEDINALSQAIETVGNSPERYTANLKRASQELNWELESEPLKAFYVGLLNSLNN